MVESAPILEVEDLHVEFAHRGGALRALDGVSFALKSGEILGVVGESGCGKSITALSIMRLIPDPPGRVARGAIRFQGKDLLALPEAQMRKIRGNDIAMIFQEPMTSLHPLLTIGEQIREPLRQHQGLSKAAANAKAIEMLRLVHMSEPERRAREYPHQLSGGMRQRVMIAMALTCQPRLLIADEPTTALDVTIQAQILVLIRQLQQEFGMAVLLITHDMGVVAENAHRVVVMYAGRIVEEALVEDLFRAPCHPYTKGLLASMPDIDAATTDGEAGRLSEIPGLVPALSERGEGCAFAPRCFYAVDRCRVEAPALIQTRPNHRAACWMSEAVMASAQ